MDETHLEGPDLTVGVALAELTEGVPLLGHVRGQAVVLVRRATKVSAVGATCTHWNGPMAEGLVVGDTIRCPWHHASFNLDTGAVVGAPAFDPLPSFTVIRDGDRVRIGDQRPVEVPVIPLGVPSSVVIVGAGAAGAACAVTLRREGYDGSITLIGDEVPVDRPNLSKDYLVGKVQAAWMPLRSSKFYRENRIAISTDDPVDIIDLADHAVRLRSGSVDASPPGARTRAPYPTT